MVMFVPSTEGTPFNVFSYEWGGLAGSGKVEDWRWKTREWEREGGTGRGEAKRAGSVEQERIKRAIRPVLRQSSKLPDLTLVRWTVCRLHGPRGSNGLLHSTARSLQRNNHKSSPRSHPVTSTTVPKPVTFSR